MEKKYKILPTIDSPVDVRKLNIKELNILGDEIENYIHQVISKIGGHYSSPLGVIDLTLALHYVYNTPKDKLVWDVGHQAYSHKIITGRRKEFSKIRKFNEISGFLKIDESPYDSFGAGHTSTSISAALGFAHARDQRKSSEKIIAVIGDGAMTGGLAYEGLNNLGYHRTQLTVILNDNSLSISESVGALSKYLTKITTNPTYNKLRKNIWDISGKIPIISNLLRKIIKKTEDGVKASFTAGGLFEELGIRYIGPVDGHNISELISVLNSVKLMTGPVLLHVYTNKSKRIKYFDSKDAVKYYSISPPQIQKKDEVYNFSKVFGDSILVLAVTNKFTCITAAMKNGTGLDRFSKIYKDRYIDVGIAEQHALTYAAGLSASGIKSIVTIYSTFIQRGYDQIIHDIAMQNLPVIICMDRAGLVGPDGPTHHGIFDIAFLRIIPNIIITSPKDGFELHDLLFTALKENKLFSIRYGKISTTYKVNYIPKLLKIGKWERIMKGENIAILAVGSMVENSIIVAGLLKKNDNLSISVYNCRFIKPLDVDMLNLISDKYKNIYLIEEGSILGGFGSSVLEYYNKNIKKNKNSITLLGIDDNFVTHGSRKQLLDVVGLSDTKIYNKIKDTYEK